VTVMQSIHIKTIACYMLGLVYEHGGDRKAAFPYYAGCFGEKFPPDISDLNGLSPAQRMVQHAFDEFVRELCLPKDIRRELGLKLANWITELHMQTMQGSLFYYLAAAESGDRYAALQASRLYCRMGRYDEAVPMAAQGLENDDKKMAVFLQYCGILRTSAGKGKPIQNLSQKRCPVAVFFADVFENMLIHPGQVILRLEDILMDEEYRPALDFFRIAAEKDNNPDTMLQYADCLFNGYGIDKQEEEAYALFNALADRNYIPARLRLAEIHAMTGDQFYDIQKSTELFMDLIELNNPRAMGEFGRLAEKGMVSMDNDGITRLYIRAAMMGDFSFIGSDAQ